MVTVVAGSAKKRLDLAVVERGLADNRSRAKALILAGDILINGEPHRHAGTVVSSVDQLGRRERPRFVSRGGEKLDFALAAFAIDVTGAVCADIGASTGGFTDCLLQRGATRVYAIDVGYGQIDQGLRDDPRVVVLERVNARYLENLPEPADIVVIDASFISLGLIFPVAARLLRAGGVCVPLIKPQFEAGRTDVGKGGVVKDPAIHRRVLEQAMVYALRDGFVPLGLVRSPLKGPAGNVEFLAHLVLKDPETPDHQVLTGMIDGVLETERIGQ